MEIQEELYQTKTELTNINNRYLLLFENSLNPIAVTDSEFKFSEVNQAFCDMLSYSRKELTNLSMPEISVKEDGSKSIFLIKKMMSGEIDHFSIMKKYLHKDGSIINAMTSVKALHDKDGNYDGSIASIQIVTLDKLKEMQSSNDYLESFARIVSHDLRAPLNNIIGLTQLLSTDKDLIKDETTQKTINLISDSTNRMLKMISETLNNSLFEKVLDTNTLVQTNMADILQDVLANLRQDIESTDAIISFAELYAVKGYYSELVQLFQNIISNSIKYKKQELAPIINISAEKQENGVKYIIADNGIGISTKSLDSIFEEFDRGDQADNNGYGIGLATCKRIVNDYNGHIHISSKINVGTTVIFSLESR